MAADANWLGAAAESSTGEAEAEDREGAALRLVAGMVDFMEWRGGNGPGGGM